MLVLSRKSQELVVVGGPGAFEQLLKVTVLEIKSDRVGLGFEADADDPCPSLEGVGTHLAGGQSDSVGTDRAEPMPE